MKLSECLPDWPKNKNEECVTIRIGEPNKSPIISEHLEHIAFNTALTACDREIDREALILQLARIHYEGLISNNFTKERLLDDFISTMPTWLRKIEK